MTKNINNWFKDISIKNKLYFIAGVMLFLIAMELITLYSMVYILSATRAYVGGEGLWSKAEKDATISLIRYANSHDEKDYQQYLSFINVVLGDRKARIELQKPNPNFEIAYQGFLEGRNLPVDIPGLINLFIWFQNTHYLKKAGALWVQADEKYIPKLMMLANELHQTIQSGTLSKEKHDEFMKNIYQINAEITVLADNFSYALGEASRWAENLVLKTVLAIAITVELSGLLMTILITFNIRKGIDEITRVAKQVRNLNFKERAERYSNDEIGQLATSFNQMIDDLEVSILSQEKEILQRKHQEQRLEIRSEITRIMVEHFKIKDAMPKILKTICHVLQLQYGAFWKIDAANHDMICVDNWCENNPKIVEFAEHTKLLKFAYGSLLPGQVWKTKRSYIMRDVTKEPNFRRMKWIEQAGLHSGFALPILVDNEVYGVLEFFTRYYHVLDENLLQMLNDISNMLGIFIHREFALNHVSQLSRLTGMAEVASNVLHNVGNTLNSIMTSIALMREKNFQSKLKSIVDLDILLQQHKSDLENFLVKNPQGQHVLEFMSLLAKEWNNENEFFNRELGALNKHVTHVKNIIMMQQSLSHVAGVKEEVSLTELIEEAIVLNKIAYERAAVNISRDFKPIKPVITNKDKLFQIMVNVIKNAVDALVESNIDERLLTIRVQEKDDSHAVIYFIDNGVGIAKDNLTKIFSHGFSTKKTGHGFGLHTSALFAEELGGSLVAESQGVGCGATFILTLPYRVKSQKEIKNDNQ